MLVCVLMHRVAGRAVETGKVVALGEGPFVEKNE